MKLNAELGLSPATIEILGLSEPSSNVFYRSLLHVGLPLMEVPHWPIRKSRLESSNNRMLSQYVAFTEPIPPSHNSSVMASSGHYQDLLTAVFLGSVFQILCSWSLLLLSVPVKIFHFVQDQIKYFHVTLLPYKNILHRTHCVLVSFVPNGENSAVRPPNSSFSPFAPSDTLSCHVTSSSQHTSFNQFPKRMKAQQQMCFQLYSFFPHVHRLTSHFVSLFVSLHCDRLSHPG